MQRKVSSKILKLDFKNKILNSSKFFFEFLAVTGSLNRILDSVVPSGGDIRTTEL